MQHQRLTAFKPEKAQILSSRALSDLLASFGKDRSLEAFRTLFDHFAPRLNSFFLKSGCAGDLAEELVQEVFLIVWKKAHLYNPTKAAASTWLFTIGRNLRIDGLRKQANMVDVDDTFFETALVVEGEQETQVDQLRLAESVRASLAALPANQAEVVRLSFYSGIAHSEIAAKLDIPLGTVKSRLRLAFGRLRTELAEVAK